MRIVATSDLHGNLPPNLPEGDVLAIVGDVMPTKDHKLQYQSYWFKKVFVPYLAGLPFETILLVAGNHDFYFQASQKWVERLPENVIYLEDESHVIDGVVFHGSPWTPTFLHWAFMAPDEALFNLKWRLIPDDCEVLLVHGPPYGLCDQTVTYSSSGLPLSVGSKTLRERLLDVRPRYVITGHIHEAYGLDEIGRTLVANVSLVDVNYVPMNAPFVFDVDASRRTP